ncbi:MAG: P1 family peptidase, partial [Dehalococcoidia bacterium]
EEPSNTTLAVVAKNARLTKAQVNRIATVAHDGFARSIWPVHTRADGDVIFALATGEQEITDDQYPSIEAMAARAVERAVLNGVRAAKHLGGVPGLAD